MRYHDDLSVGIFPRIFRDRVEHRKALGMLRHQTCAGFLRVSPTEGELVHEVFEIDGVVIDVHATPEAR